jgi:FkbM family methyltransferase
MKKIVIEVGCHDAEDTLKIARMFPNVDKIYGFECHPHWFNVSRQRCSENPLIEIVQQAVFLEDCQVTKFNECKQGGASSLLEFKADEELVRVWGANRQDIHSSGKSYDVSTTRIDTFLTSQGYTPENTMIQYTHIDAQGVDLEALISFGKFLPCLERGVLETVYSTEKAIYVNQKDNCLVNVLKFLTDNNFQCESVDPNDPTGCEVNVRFRR